MAGWHRNRYVRLGIGSFAVAVAVSMVAPPSMASAAAVRPKPGGASSNPQRNVPDAKHKTTPGSAAPSNPASGQSPSHRSAPPPAAKPSPVQRKDKPPDRDAHKSSPQHRASAPQRPNRHKNNNRENTNRQQDRPATHSAAPGANSRSGGTPQAAGTPSNGLNDILDKLSEAAPVRPGQQLSRRPLPGARGAAPVRPGKQASRRPLPGTRGAAPARPDQQTRCGKDGCLVLTPPPAKPKPPRPKVRSLDNRKVVDAAEEELRKWNEANENRRRQIRQNYADAHNGPGSAIVDWCARFVTYVYAQAGMPLPDMQRDKWDQSNNGFQLVKSGATWAKAQPGWWHPGTDGIQPGDIVIYDGENHTGVVSRVYDDGSFDTIEGNTGGGPANQSDMTKQRLTGSEIEGYIRPPANR